MNLKTGPVAAMLDGAGGWVDALFLRLPGILKFFQPARQIDPAFYARQMDYYFENGYVVRPETFFQLPESCPEYSVLSEAPFESGIRRCIAFSSEYAVRNPEIRDRYAAFAENRTAYVYHWTHAGPARPTILCLHGYLLGDPLQAEKMFRVHTLFRMGMNVALFITPFHGMRAPREKKMRGIFLQPEDVVMTCECFGQAMSDLHQTMGLLASLGSDRIGLIGASLGGYLAGLYAGLTDRADFVALMVPAVCLTKPFGPDRAQLSFTPDIEMQKKMKAIWTLHSPLNFSPRIPKERILVIASRGDRLCPFEHVLQLCKKWNWPRHCFMTGGHWLVFNGRERGRFWYRFLEDMDFPVRDRVLS